jgi:hypothetical protein
MLSLIFSGSEGSIMAVSGYGSEIVSIVMPARVEPNTEVPDFVNFGGGEPKEKDE